MYSEVGRFALKVRRRVPFIYIGGRGGAGNNVTPVLTSCSSSPSFEDWTRGFCEVAGNRGPLADYPTSEYNRNAPWLGRKNQGPRSTKDVLVSDWPPPSTVTNREESSSAPALTEVAAKNQWHARDYFEGGDYGVLFRGSGCLNFSSTSIVVKQWLLSTESKR